MCDGNLAMSNKFTDSNDEDPREKQLAKWIYYEENNEFYCSECIEKRLEEINNNKEFSDSIDYENGDTCGYCEDYANEEEAVYCCKCEAPLYSLIDC
jgi:hypothetical protein